MSQYNSINQWVYNCGNKDIDVTSGVPLHMKYPHFMKHFFISFLFALFLYVTIFGTAAYAQQLVLINTDNSPLPSDNVCYFTQDDSGAYWIACAPEWVNGAYTGGGLARYDGANWQIFNTENSDLPSNSINHVVIGPDGTLWVATVDAGIASYDGMNWQVFNSSNSSIPEDAVYTLSFDRNGIMWIGTYNSGTAGYDGEQWQVYDKSNSGIGSNNVNFIVAGANDIKWIGSDYYGLVTFDGLEWNSHGEGYLSPGINTSIVSFAIDSRNDQWVGGIRGGTGGALARVRSSPAWYSTVSALMPRSRTLLWDIGAGCGSVSIEWLRMSGHTAHAIAIEQNPERCRLIEQNADQLGAPRLRIVCGKAPEALAGLPRPDVVFLGGAVADEAVFEAAWEALPRGGWLVANAISLQAEQALLARHAKYGGELMRMHFAHAAPLSMREESSPAGATAGMAEARTPLSGYQVFRQTLPVTQWRVRKP